MRAACTLKSLAIIASITVFFPNIAVTILYALYFKSDILMHQSNGFYIVPEIFNILSNLMFYNSVINAAVYWYHIKEFRDFIVEKIQTCFCCVKKRNELNTQN